MRKLNLEERRRMEKLLFADIEGKVQEYTSKQSKEKDVLIDKLNKNIPTDIVKVFAEYQEAHNEADKKKEYLSEDGYDTNGYGDKERVEVSTYGTQPKELEEFDQKTERTKKKLEALKREFTLKLYAGDSAEMNDLFDELMKRLEAVDKAV